MSKSEPHELLAELTRLESLRATGSDYGKRQFNRFVVRADAELTPMDRTRLDQPRVPILLRDLGKGGIGFVTEEPLDLNSTWHVSFLKDGYVIGCQGLTIRHRRHIKDSTHLVGGQFCATSGLLSLLGIKPGALRDPGGTAGTDGNDASDQDDFISPEDM